jgi:hypothetical protein
VNLNADASAATISGTATTINVAPNAQQQDAVALPQPSHVDLVAKFVCRNCRPDDPGYL